MVHHQYSLKILVQPWFELYPDLSSLSQILLVILVHWEATATTADAVDQSEQGLVEPLAGIGQQILQLLRLSPCELRFAIKSGSMN